MFSLVSDLQLDVWPLVALDWLSMANDATNGLLDVVLALGVVATVVIPLFYYLRDGNTGDSDNA